MQLEKTCKQISEIVELEVKMHCFLFVLAVFQNANANTVECPAGMHAKKTETCEECKIGFFKSSPSASKCAAHTKCPKGKYTIVSGTNTTQPVCKLCSPGLFKRFISKSSIACIVQRGLKSGRRATVLT